MRDCWIVFAAVFLALQPLGAQEPEVETIATGLTNPTAVAIQPETGVVHVADSGAGRIVRIVDGQMSVVVAGFPLDKYGKDPGVTIGPLGMTFLDRERLVVGGGGLPDGEELLRVYKLPKEGALDAAEMVAQLKLPAQNDFPGEGNFYGVTSIRGAVYVSCNGDDTKGWIARTKLDGDQFGPLERAIPTRVHCQTDAPVALAASKDGSLVVGQAGEVDTPGDSLLCFYEPAGGTFLGKYATGLSDITGRAFSPSGRLYAVDFSWQKAEAGGLFELLTDRENPAAVKARPILKLERPSALVFDDEGAAYVTVFGEADQQQPAGRLVRIPKGL